ILKHMTKEELLTVAEVARICRVHEVTVRRNIRSGRLRAVRVGRRVRVSPLDLDLFLHPMPESLDEDVALFWATAQPLTEDDPIFKSIGSVDIPDAANLSEEKMVGYRPEW